MKLLLILSTLVQKSDIVQLNLPLTLLEAGNWRIFFVLIFNIYIIRIKIQNCIIVFKNPRETKQLFNITRVNTLF